MEIENKKEKLAYLIICHKDSHLVRRLLRAIYDPENIYLINIDKKAPESFRKKVYSDRLAQAPNVRFLGLEVNWSEWSEVQVELEAMRLALEERPDWTHFINLSGQDFPLKTQEEIRTYLSAFAGNSFIEAHPLDPDSDEARLFLTEGRNQGRGTRVDRENPDIRFYKGSQWLILSRDFCRYAVESQEAKRLKSLVENNFVPDETFFQTLAANWEGAASIIWENKRLIDWSAGGAHPITLKTKHYPRLVASSAFFARKFDLWADRRVVKRLESHLGIRKAPAWRKAFQSFFKKR